MGGREDHMVEHGTTVRGPTPTRSNSTSTWVRLVLLLAFWAVGVIAGLKAASAAYLTYATNDYRPILIRGVWACAVAFSAFHFAALSAKGWAGRLPGFVGALVVLYVLSQILHRLR